MGTLTLVTEPNPAGGANFTTSYSYNAANQLTGVSMPRPCAGGTCTQTRSFTWTGTDLTASTNPENGTVTYQYDGAHHVTQRTDAKGQVTQYTYDTDPATNRQTGVTYDANGNSLPSGASVDEQDRYVWTPSGGPYAYDPSNKRVADLTSTGIGYFYSITGQRLATYAFSGNYWNLANTNVYFGSKLLRSNGVTVATDRLGSVRANANGERMSYFPYGEEQTATADDR